MKVAIVYYKEYDSGDDYARVADSITDWAEVSPEELRLLERWVHNIKNKYGMNYAKIIIQENGARVPVVISECMKLAAEYAEKEAEERKKREQAKLEKAKKKRAASEEQERALLAELEAKYKKED